MGFPLSNARFFCEQVARLAPAGGDVLLLGRPDVRFQQARFVEFADAAGIPYAPQEPFDGVTLWRGLGYAPHVLDASDYEGADVICDLNNGIPPAWDGLAALVFDPGTLEHVFDAAAVLRGIVRALPVGGVVMHHSPLAGWVDHGFWTPSPCVFHEFYERHGFRHCLTAVADMGPRIADQDEDDGYWVIGAGSSEFRRLPPGRWVQYFVARKAEDRPYAPPVQRRYTEGFWRR